MKLALTVSLGLVFATVAAAAGPRHEGTIVFVSNRVPTMWSPDLMVVGPGGRTRNLTQSTGIADKDSAISPDGRQVVFSRRDGAAEDLYAIGVAGGNLRRLTSTPQLYEQTPAFSPAGDAVAFVRGTLHADDAIWILDSKGEHRLTPHEGWKESVVWSPDGKRLAYMTEVGRLFLLNRDGSGLREVGAPGASDESSLLRWERSGIVIGAPSGQDRFALASIDPEHGGRRALPNPCGNERPVFSTAGRHVICHGTFGRSIRIRTRAGKKVRSVVVHPRNENRQIGGYALGPNGGTLVYDALTEERHGDLWLSAGKLTRLTQGPDEDHSPALSPDRRRVVFLRSGYQSRWQDGALFLLDLRTRRARPLKGLRGSTPSWSADGKRIVFGCGHDLCIVPIGKARPRRLTRDANLDSDPSWSPDGRWIAFVRTTRRRTTLRLIRPDGGKTRVLLTRSVSSPAWSPDGHSLALVVGRAVAVLTLTDGKVLELARDDDNRLHSPTWSPNGQHIAYATGWENDIPYPWHAPNAHHLEIWTVDVRTRARAPLIRTAGFNYAPSWR